jgi:hypothetical protein
MVAPKPNETRLRGVVREIKPSQRRPALVELVVDVEQAADVEGRANLLAGTPGGALPVTADAEDLSGLHLRPGERVVLGAEVRGPGAIWSRPQSVRRDA